MSAIAITKSHKDWRKDVKKFRRKRIRRKLAKERDRKEDETQSKLLSNPDYQFWLQEQEILNKFQEEMEQRLHDDQEEKWMRRELLAQKKFQEEKKRQEAVDEAKEKERQRIQKEFDEQQKIVLQRLAEKKRLAEEKRIRHALLLKKIDEFVKNGGDLPEELYEMAESNPGKDPCPFFIKTATCRFGDKCSRNHSRPGISRTLLLHHFFTNIRLDQPQKSEYGTDLSLEYSESELYKAYDEFFEDVTDEICKFGEIVNFRTCKNAQPQLRGNVYVEYRDERSAMRAFQKLYGRYYASRRINVEFCKLISWKAAICGLSLSRKCPKGDHCNYLHIFKNPKNKYNAKDPQTEGSVRVRQNTGDVNASENTPSWNDVRVSTLRNWRWSESPENDASSSNARSSRRSSEQSNSRLARSREERRHSDRFSRRSRTRSKSPHKRSARRPRSRSRSTGSRSKRSTRASRSRSKSPKRKRRDDSRSLDNRRSTRRNSASPSNNNNSKSTEHSDLKIDQINEVKLKRRSKSKDRKKRKRRKRSNSKSRKKANKESK